MDDKTLLELARSYISYDPVSGEITWIKSTSNAVKIGSMSGKSVNSDGYRLICFFGVFYKVHRLAWFLTFEKWPDQIDHINGIRHDNRLENLSSVTGQINTHNQKKAHSNSSTGVLGVVPKLNGKFSAEIRLNGKKIHIGTFSTVEEASLAYKEAKNKLHPGAIVRVAAAIAEQGGRERMNDKTLLELAARAAGYETCWNDDKLLWVNRIENNVQVFFSVLWNPLTDDGDALRLAVKLRIMIDFIKCGFMAGHVVAVSKDSFYEEGFSPEATRRAIVRAAAAIAEQGEKE